MGLSSLVNRVSYTGDGSSTVFSFPYAFFSQNDFRVYLFDTNSSLVYAQTLSTNYTVTGNVSSAGTYLGGGNIVMNSAFPSNLQIIITRSPSRVQNFALNQNGPIPSASLVQQFDYLTALVQRLQDDMVRCVKMPDGIGPVINGSSFNPVLPDRTPLRATGGSPLILNSGATGWDFGLVISPTQSSYTYLGTLPVVNGGTGQNSGLTPLGVWYSASGSSMAMTAAGGQDIPLIGNGNAPPAFQALNLASQSSVTNALGASNGGTGMTAFTPNGIVYASSTTIMSVIAAATLGVLTANGSSAPTFQTMSLGSSTNFVGVLPIAKGGTGATTANGGFVALSPMANRGDIIITGSAGVQKALAIGADGLFLGADSTNADGIRYFSAAAAALSVTTQTATYNAQPTDTTIIAASGCGQINLYGPSGNSGRAIRIKKTSNSFDKLLITCSAATIDGTSILFTTYNEVGTFVPDSTNWYVFDRQWPAGWQSYTPTLTTGFGTPTVVHSLWMRIGGSIIINARFSAAVISSSTAAWSLPAGLTGHASLAASSAVVGSFVNNVNGALNTYVLITPNGAALNFGLQNAGNGGLTPATTNGIANANIPVGFYATVPIQGWQG